MKKMIYLLFCFINIPIFSQISIPNFVHTYAEDDIYYIGYNNRLYECNTWERKYHDITDICFIDNNGFLRINYKKSSITYFIIKEELHYLILSPHQFFILESDSRINAFKDDIEPPYGYKEIFIRNIKSNTYLIENNLFYESKNFLNRFFSTDKEFPYEYWSKTLPLAISSNQINSFELEIEFTDTVNGMLILNGFVDFNRPYLYKDNRRIKEIVVTDKNNHFSLNYILKDIIQFQEIVFPEPSNSIKIKIISYYEGDKYTDICCSAITPIFNQRMRQQGKIYEPNYNEIVYQMLNNFEEIK
jgi:hypothetical protein